MAVGINNLFVYISFFIGAFGLTFRPSPTANCQRYKSLTLTCSINEDWNFVAFNLESRHGSINVAAFTDEGGSCKDNAAPTPGLFQTSCDYNSKTFYLTITNITDIYNGKFIECSYLPRNIQATTIINVQYVPTSSPLITQLPNRPIIEGSKITLTCKISGGNPLASLVWLCTGFTTITSTNTPLTDEVVLSIEHVVTKDDNGKECVCTGKHPLWTKDQLKRHTLAVYFKPTTFPLIIQTPQGPVNNNESIVLTCSIPGGNPLAVITWQCRGYVPVTPTVSPSSTTSVSNIQLTVNRDLNGAACTCIGTHPAWIESKRTDVILDVRYAPASSPKIIQMPTGPINKGDTITLTCKISIGNPLATIVWQCSMYNVIAPTVTPPTDESVSMIRRVVTKEDNGKECLCIGKHLLWDDDKETRHTLAVYYFPSIHMEPIYNPFIIYHNQHDVVLICVVDDANPSKAVIYEWNSPSGTMNTQNISIPTVTNLHSGHYSCTAKNIAGTSNKATKQINVHYGPMISNISNQHDITEGNNLIVSPIVDANPVSRLVWWTNQNDANFRYDGSVLIINNINRKSSGNYSCYVMNTLAPSGMSEINRTTQQTFSVNVVFKPFLDNTKPYSPGHVTAAKNSTIRLTLTVNANPVPTIEWTFRADKDWNSCNFVSIVSNTTSNEFFTTSSVLINNVNSNNFGDYVFTARNTVGVFSRRFVAIEEALLRQNMFTSNNSKEKTGMFLAGIITLVVGLLSLMASVIFVVRNRLKNKTIESSKTDQYIDVQRSNPAFTDAYTTLQSDIETIEHQEQITNTYEECGRISEAHANSSVDNMESEPNQSQQYGLSVNTYEECGERIEAHAYDTLNK